MELRRAERLVRSTILGWPFPATNAVTRFEVEGREHLEAALARRDREGRGLITISNHQSLFDDPLVLCELLGLRFFTVESKRWWSTPCQHNFCPSGTSPKDRFVRYFSDVSNMIFFERPSKNGEGIRIFEELAPTMARRIPAEALARFEAAAGAEGLDLEAWLGRFVTAGDGDRLAPLNQIGMIEACARLVTGDWVHFFPEGTRSRTLALKEPKRGVGKVIYHAAEAEVLPICFYGMHDVLPVSAAVPRPLQRVVVTVGAPIAARHFDRLRCRPPTPETFGTVVEVAWEAVKALRPATLARYLGPAKAAEVLLAEAPAAFSPAGEVTGHPLGAADRMPGRRRPERASAR